MVSRSWPTRRATSCSQRTAVGRVGFMVDGEIDILPVCYVMDGRAPAFRTTEGEKLGKLR